MTFEAHYANPQLALWMRVTLFAHDHNGTTLKPGELRHALDPHSTVRPAEISRAIQRARAAAILTPTSTASRLTIAHTQTAASEAS